MYRKRVNWVLDADIRDFFTSLDRGWLGKFLRHRIADEGVLRLIGKWLAAGVVEDGLRQKPGAGVPARGIAIAVAGERVPASRAGPVGGVVEEAARAGSGDHRAVR